MNLSSTFIHLMREVANCVIQAIYTAQSQKQYQKNLPQKGFPGKLLNAQQKASAHYMP